MGHQPGAFEFRIHPAKLFFSDPDHQNDQNVNIPLYYPLVMTNIAIENHHL